MIGGNLPSGTARYYRVTLATQDPTWVSKTVILKIDGNCKVGNIIDENGTATNVPLDANLSTLFAADQQQQTAKDAVEIGVFPNPAMEAMTLRIQNGLGGNCSWAMFDLKGAQWMQSEVSDSELQTGELKLQRPAGLPAGVYMLQVKLQGQTYYKRVLWQ